MLTLHTAAPTTAQPARTPGPPHDDPPSPAPSILTTDDDDNDETRNAALNDYYHSRAYLSVRTGTPLFLLVPRPASAGRMQDDKWAELNPVRPIPRGSAADRGFDLEAPPQLRTCPFSFFCANWAPSARETSWPSAAAQWVPARATAMTRFIFFSSTSRRAIPGTLPACARSNAFPGPPSRLSLSRHATCHGGRLSTDFGIAGSAGCAPLRNNGGLTENRLLYLSPL